MQKGWRSVATLKRFLAKGDEGQGLVEYVLILLLFSIALVGALSGFGNALQTLYGGINTTVLTW